MKKASGHKFLAIPISVLAILSCYLIFKTAVVSTTAAIERNAPIQAQSRDNSSPETLVLTDSQNTYPLGLHLGILEDPTGKLTIEDVTSPVYSSQFVPSHVAVPNYGYNDSAYWVRLHLKNETRATTEWVLEQGFANTQYIDLYSPLPNGVGYAVKETGYLQPVNTRDVVYPYFVFNLNIPSQALLTYYMRFESGSSITLPLTLFTRDAFYASSIKDLSLHWLIFGGMIALILYHLFLLATLREVTYLYFVAMLVSMLAVLLDYTGYLGVYILPSLYQFKPVYLPLSVSCMSVSFILFSDAFLGLKAHHPKLHRVNIGLMISWGVVMLMSLFISYNNVPRLLSLAQILSIVITMVVILAGWKIGVRWVDLFVFSLLVMIAGLFILVLVRLGVISSTYLTENVFILGFIFMAVCWSIALADRINRMKHETEKANGKLRSSESKLSQILDGLPMGVVVYDKDQKPTYINQRSAEIIGNPDVSLQPDPSNDSTFAQELEHYTFQVAGSHLDYPPDKFPLNQAFNGSAASTDDVEMIQGDKRVPLEIWASPIKDEGGNVNAAVAVFQDITERRRAEAELVEYRKNLEQLVQERTVELSSANQQLDRQVSERKNLEYSLVQRIEWLSALIQIHQNISGLASLPEAYGELSDTVLQLLDASTVFIFRWDEQEKEFDLHCRSRSDGTLLDSENIKSIFMTGSPIRQKLEKGKAILFAHEQAVLLPEALQTCFLEKDVQSLFLSPMMHRHAVIGVLGVAGPNPVSDFIPYQVDLIERMAFDLATLIDDAILIDQKRMVATLEERNRLARELHDSVAQALYGISLFTDATRLAVESNKPEVVNQHLDDLSELSQEAIADMRMLIFELRPPVLEKEGLAAALQTRLESVEARAGFQTVFKTKGKFDLSQDRESELYRIAQEALNNVLKHAHAKQVKVQLNAVADGIWLIIEDDGVGFDLATAEQGGGQGFRNMRERAEMIGATCSIQSSPGHGTKISVEVKQ